MRSVRAKIICAWLVSAAACALSSSVFALSESAIFSIDTTTHTGKVMRLAVLPGERQVVTAGFDKTIRIWDAADGSLLKRWVVPVADEADGTIAALAVSPDGKRLAVGGRLIGFDGRLRTVLVLEVGSGRIVSKLTEFLADVSALAWTPDGKFLAVGTSNASGMGGVVASVIELFDTQKWEVVSSDQEISGYLHDIAFGRGNSLIATVEDRRIQQWGGNARWPGGRANTSRFFLRTYFCPGGQCTLHKQMEQKRRDLVRVYTQADGDIFVGGESLFDSDTWVEKLLGLNFLLGKEDEVLGVQSAQTAGDVFAISGSRHSSNSVIHRWKSLATSISEQVRIPDPQISDFRVLSDGRIVYVSESGVLASYDRGLKLLWRNSRPIAGSISDPGQVRVSADGLWIALPEGAGDESRSMAFNLGDPGFQPKHLIRTTWSEPITGNSSIGLTGWQRGDNPMVNKRDFPLSNGERSTTVAVHTVDDSFVFGSTFGRVRRVVGNGSATWTRYFHSEVVAVRQVEARKWVVVVTADGFVRVLRERDGETLVSYYVEPAAKKWLAVSDLGYYEAGIGADDLAGWIVNRDHEHLADFFPLSRFRDTYLLPGHATESLRLGDQGEAVRGLLDRLTLAQAGGQKASEREAEAARKQAERQAEEVRKADEARQLAEQQAEAARRDRQARLAAERREEAVRFAAEQKRQDDLRQAELVRQEALRRVEAELARQIEDARLALERRRQEELAKQEAEAKRKEALRLAEEELRRAEAAARKEAEVRRAEAARQAERARQEAAAREAEAARLAEQAGQAEVQAAAARLAEARRLEALQAVEAERQQQLARAKAELVRLNAIAATAIPAGQLVQQATPELNKLPPVVDILSPGFEVAQSEARLKVRYRIKTPEGAPVTRVQGRVIARSQATRGLMPKIAGSDVQEMDLELPGEDSEVQIVAENQWGASVPATIKVRWQGAAPKARTIKGDLHIIAVGVSDYDQPDYKLGLASKDAQDFVATLRKQEGGFYGKVQLKVLTDRQADKKSVEDAILGLRSQVQPQDTTMVFLAGHGVNDVGGEYVYLPRDAKLEQLGQTGVSFRLIRDTLARLPGRTVMFVDTCHSGNVVGKLRPGQNKDYTAAINEMASSENNIIVFASSTGTQLSLEDPSWGNGAFTKALVEGLSGQADMKKRGRVTYKQLDAYVSDRVDELTQGRQTPVTPVLQGVPDFTLAEVKK